MPVPLLTRAESLAIANAIDRKMQQSSASVAAASPAPQGMTREQLAQVTDSLRSAIQGAVIDSFMRLQKNMQPPTAMDARPGRGGNIAVDVRGLGPNVDEVSRISRGMMTRDPSLTRRVHPCRHSAQS